MGIRILIVLVFAVTGCQSEAPPEASDPSSSGDAGRPEDWIILDAAIGDMLTNPTMADSRAFYGSGGTRVLYNAETFPIGYVPNVKDFQFGQFDRGARAPHEAPKALTVDARWFRGRPMLPPGPGEDPLKANQAYRDHHKDWGGIELCIYNGGGSGGGPIPIGGCSIYYDVIHKDGAWRVTYAGAFDP